MPGMDKSVVIPKNVVNEVTTKTEIVMNTESKDDQLFCLPRIQKKHI